MPGSYELIDHTGDIGIRVRGDTLEDVFASAARAMFDILVEAADVRPQREDVVVVEGEAEELLRGWLAELLYRFCVDAVIYREFDLDFSRGRLRARARGERMDPARHRLGTELKAVTWHGLFVKRDGPAWVAQVIFDV